MIDINWNPVGTDMPYYDGLLRDPAYYRRAKGITGKIEWMSPSGYLEKVAAMFGTTAARTLIWVDPVLAEKYADRMEDGDLFPIPVINYDLSEQEGRHRAYAALILGVRSIPVLVVRPVREPGSGRRRVVRSPVRQRAKPVSGIRGVVDRLK